ncbi:hypothetical protein JCM10212_006456 [Sporobolomyces blumeae]
MRSTPLLVAVVACAAHVALASSSSPSSSDLVDRSPHDPLARRHVPAMRHLVRKRQLFGAGAAQSETSAPATAAAAASTSSAAGGAGGGTSASTAPTSNENPLNSLTNALNPASSSSSPAASTGPEGDSTSSTGSSASQASSAPAGSSTLDATAATRSSSSSSSASAPESSATDSASARSTVVSIVSPSDSTGSLASSDGSTSTASGSASSSSSSTSAAAATADKSDDSSSGGIGHGTLIAIIVVASCVAGIAAIWTIIRKTKFSPSRRFEAKLEPIDFVPEVPEYGHHSATAAGGGGGGGGGAGVMRERSQSSLSGAYLNGGYEPSLARSDSKGSVRGLGPSDSNSHLNVGTIPYQGPGYVQAPYYGAPAPSYSPQLGYPQEQPTYYPSLQRGLSSASSMGNVQNPMYTNNGAGVGAGGGIAYDYAAQARANQTRY